MTAVFPNGFKDFTAKKNLIDDVEASHINDIQNEIMSIEKTLGKNPTQIELSMPDGKSRDYGTVVNRLTTIELGKHIPITRLLKSNTSIKTSTNTYIGFDRLNDPYGHYNTSDITIKADGWWFITAQCWWSNSSTSSGYRLLRMEQNGSARMQDMKPASMGGSTRNMMCHFTWQGLAHVGDRIRIMVYQNSGRTISLDSCWLQATMHRWYDPTLFNT